MKRKNYILLLAAAMLASSCANDDVIDTSAKVEMKFRVTADSPTRAANAYCNNNLPPEFTLCCKYQGSHVPVFDYERLTKSGDYYIFDNQNNYYWSGNNYFEYQFLATNAPIPSSIPDSADEWDSYKDNDGEEGYHFVSRYFNNIFCYKNHIIHSPKANASEQTDLLFAYTQKNCDEVTDGVVTLNFAHLLSKVVFYVKVTDPHLLVQVDEVKVCKVYTKGRFEMNGSIELPHTDGNTEDHTGGATAPTYLDKLDMHWYANTTRPVNDTQHTGLGAYDYTTGNFGLKSIPKDAAGVGTAVSLSDETNSAEGHTTSENTAHTLMLIPQVTNAWVPSDAGMKTPTAEGQTGSYFLVKCRIWDTKTPGVLVDPSDKTNGSVELWPNKSGVTTEYIAIPFAADWKMGRKYVYTFVFGNSGGFGGYDPATGDKVLLPIKLTCDVHEFADVEYSGDLDR